MLKSMRELVSRGDNKNLLRLSSILLLVAALGALASQGVLLHPDNILNVLQQNTVLLIVVGAQFLVVVTGGFDLSVGAAVSLASVVFVATLDLGPVTATFCALGSGLALGLLNGLIVTFVRLPSFVVTLATMQIGYSVARLVTGGGTMDASAAGTIIPASWLGIFGITFLAIPLPIWLALFTLLVVALYLRTATGYFVFAIGGNARAAYLAGAPVDFTRVATYALASLVAAVAGVLFCLRVGYGDPQAALTMPLDSIAAVSLGGVSLIGGRGSLVAAVMGVVILAMLDNLLNLLGISVLLQPVVKGVIIIMTVWAYSLQKDA